MKTFFLLLLVLTTSNALPAEFVTPEQFGALGNGRQDDTAALEQTFAAASRSDIPAVLSQTYLVSRQLTIDSRIRLEGGGTILAAPGIENTIGVRGTDSLLRFTVDADGSSLKNLTFDLADQGRTAIRVEADGMSISGVSIVNYRKTVKADNRKHSKSESGIRISASNVTITDVHCQDMVTLVMDAVPRCITIHGDADTVNLTNISGTRINGGITVGSSTNVRVRDVNFRVLDDNGFYLLPGSSGFVAQGGHMSDVNEAIVFKGRDATVIGLSIHNQQQAIGLEDATGVSLSNIRVTHDENLPTRPSFIRTRNGNDQSTGVRMENITADIPLGSSVLNFSVGSVSDVSIVDSTFELRVSSSLDGPAHLLRQNEGAPPELVNTHFKLTGDHAGEVNSIVMKAPGLGEQIMNDFKTRNYVTRDGDPVVVRARAPRRRRQVQ